MNLKEKIVFVVIIGEKMFFFLNFEYILCQYLKYLVFLVLMSNYYYW